jgi:hypothetical protein
MWGFLDEMLPAPWCQGDGTRLYRIKQVAWARDLPIEAVMGHAPRYDSSTTRTTNGPARWSETQPVETP